MQNSNNNNNNIDHFQDTFNDAFDMHFNQVIQSQMKAEQVWQEEFAQSFSNALTVQGGEVEEWDKAFSRAASNHHPGGITVEEFLNEKNQMTEQQQQQQDLDAEDAEYFSHLQKEYEDIWKQASSSNPMYSMLESENGGNLASLAERPIPTLHSYAFSQQNPYLLSENSNAASTYKSIAEWRAQAMEAYSQGEPIKATQILEACLQEHNQQANTEEDQISNIWDLLGTWQSENENEVQAMAAFEACLKIDSKHTHAIQVKDKTIIYKVMHLCLRIWPFAILMRDCTGRLMLFYADGCPIHFRIFPFRAIPI